MSIMETKGKMLRYESGGELHRDFHASILDGVDYMRDNYGEDEPAQVLFPGAAVPGREMIGAGEQVERPAQGLGREEGRERAVEDDGREVEEFGPQPSQHIAQDVHQDDEDGGEFHREAPPLADKDREDHREKGEDDRIRPSEKGADDDSRHVQRGETVDEPAGTDPFHIHG